MGFLTILLQENPQFPLVRLQGSYIEAKGKLEQAKGEFERIGGVESAAGCSRVTENLGEIIALVGVESREKT